VELGFAAERFDIGDVKDDIKAGTGVDLSRDDVYLYNFNARAMVIEENSFCKFTPALTAGVHYKYNDGIDSIDDQLFGSFSDIGLENNQGVEFTLMASKMFPKLGFGRPLIVSAGLRETQAAWMGFLGFSDEWSTNFEGNVIWLPFDWMAVGYELRQQSDPYDQIPGLVEDEDWLQTFSVILMPNSHFNVSLVYGLFGRVLNEDENHVLAVQAKWEF
jgi:hypothetical protein